MRTRTLRAGALAAGIVVCACGGGAPDPAPPGDASRGRALLHDYGCGACHSIPGVAAAIGRVGPPLDDVGRRVYLAGEVPNSPDRMAQWIRTPEAFKPGTPMPNLHVSERDAKDMVAHLYRLR